MPPNTRRYFEESEQLLKGRSPESPEFSALMRSKIGGQFQNLVTPERLGVMALVGNPNEANWDTAGVRFNPLVDNSQIKQFLGPVLEDANQELPQGKRIFGIGAKADVGTYAHELRHENVGNEEKNRFFDVMYGSTSIPSYKANIERAYDHLIDTPEYRNSSFEERWFINNVPLQQKEKLVLDTLKGKEKSWILKDAAINEGISIVSSFNSEDIENFIDKNLKLNRTGAVGGMKGSKTLPKDILEFRSKFPFLNFIGRLEDETSKRKSSGGNVEKMYVERKLI